MNDEVMADIQRSLGRIEQKVDTALAWQQTHVTEDHAAFETIRADIKGLQLVRATQSGKASVLAALLAAGSGGFGALVTLIFNRHAH